MFQLSISSNMDFQWANDDFDATLQDWNETGADGIKENGMHTTFEQKSVCLYIEEKQYNVYRHDARTAPAYRRFTLKCVRTEFHAIITSNYLPFYPFGVWMTNDVKFVNVKIRLLLLPRKLFSLFAPSWNLTTKQSEYNVRLKLVSDRTYDTGNSLTLMHIHTQALSLTHTGWHSPYSTRNYYYIRTGFVRCKQWWSQHKISLSAHAVCDEQSEREGEEMKLNKKVVATFAIYIKT